jgi:hypothetical protein
VILQLTPWVEFSSMSITLPLVRPSTARSIIALGIMMRGAPSPAITSVVDSTGQRWRMANTTVRAGGRLDLWWTGSRIAGASEVIATTANGIPATGAALAVEAMARVPGDVIQLLADVISGHTRLTRLRPPPPPPAPEPDDPELAVWARFAGALQDGAL